MSGETMEAAFEAVSIVLLIWGLAMLIWLWCRR